MHLAERHGNGRRPEVSTLAGTGGSAISQSPLFFSGLEPRNATRLLLAVNRHDLRVGVPAGILAATATSGALIAIGLRVSTAARPFNEIAGHVLGTQRAGAFGFVPSVTITGIALHVLLMILAGIAVAVVARRRIAPDWVATLILTLLSALVSVGIARRDGASLARLLAVGDLVLFYATLAVSLVVGIRLAFFEPTRDRSRRVDSM